MMSQPVLLSVQSGTAGMEVSENARVPHVDDSVTKSILDHLESWRPHSSAPESRWRLTARACGRNKGRQD
jgi:hypothetical protein